MAPSISHHSCSRTVMLKETLPLLSCQAQDFPLNAVYVEGKTFALPKVHHKELFLGLFDPWGSRGTRSSTQAGGQGGFLLVSSNICQVRAEPQPSSPMQSSQLPSQLHSSVSPQMKQVPYMPGTYMVRMTGKHCIGDALRVACPDAAQSAAGRTGRCQV